jgi:hypothetical protein
MATAGAAEKDQELVAQQTAAKAGEEGGRLVEHVAYYWLLAE